jgi:hypothetical protein
MGRRNPFIHGFDSIGMGSVTQEATPVKRVPLSR